jgi:hypothetical protein
MMKRPTHKPLSKTLSTSPPSKANTYLFKLAVIGVPGVSALINFPKKTLKIDSIFNASYQIVHLNYSKENKNEKTFAQYGFPQRFGFPVFLILDSTGKLIHTQNSEYLEDNKGSYDAIKVFNFLKAWTPQSIDPQTYLNKK